MKKVITRYEEMGVSHRYTISFLSVSRIYLEEYIDTDRDEYISEKKGEEND